MKVLYDHQAFTFQRFGGVSKCFCELISNMPEGVEAQIAVKESENVHLSEAELLDFDSKPRITMRQWKKVLPFKGSGLLYRILLRMNLISTMENKNRHYAIQLLRKGDFDVFHPTFFDSYFLRYIGEKPWVITVHDMMPELFPEYFGSHNEQIVFKRKYLKEASAIIAVSEQTKSDIVRLLGISEERITVVYHGGPEKEEVKGESLVDAPYFLYVGTRDAYKNFPQTLVDFSEFHASHPEVKLVCTGGSFTKVELAMIERLKMSNNIVHMHANDNEMKLLYAHAVAFIYPSLYEGFGMPILEAFAYGCPVLLNNRSCFPEIAAEAGLYFDSEPGKSNLLETMNYIYSVSAIERQQIIEKGYLRLADFSWKKSSEKLTEVYRNVIQKSCGGVTGNFV